jgi:hypothetical protein
MGTSAARRAPTTRFWRLAKGAATRYLSPEGGAQVEAREVVARYLAALKETGGQGDQAELAAFRLTRKAAQNLGDFWSRAASEGVAPALAARGLADLAEQPREVLALGLAAALMGPGGGLEAAVGRVSLATILPASLPLADSPAGPQAHTPAPKAGELARQFLVRALYLRLVLDLGEPLEAAAPSFSRLQDGLQGLSAWIEEAEAGAAAGEPPPPGRWDGLEGWAWVTRVLEALIQQLNRR